MKDVMGETPDIAEYLVFGFYGRISFKGNAVLGMMDIIRWLGVSHRVGVLVSYWILNHKVTVISRTTVQRLINIETETYKVKASVSEFDTEISCRSRRKKT